MSDGSGISVGVAPAGRKGRPALVGATVGILAWGALAFGGNYPWAYTPLMIGAAVVGVIGAMAPAAHTRTPWPVVGGIGAVACGALLQLVPVPQAVITAISPATHRFLQNYSLAYAISAVDGTAQHPLSIVPARTWLALAFLGSFTLLLVGTARMLSREALRLLAGCIAALGVLLSVVGVVQHAMWNGRVYGVWQTVMGGSPFGPFVNYNHFAGWMLMALPLTLGLVAAQVSRGMPGVKRGLRNRVVWFSSCDASQTILAAFAALVMGLGLVMTFSRSGMVGFLAAVTITTATVLLRQQRGGGRIVLLGYLVLLPIAIAAWVGFDAIATRFANTGRAAFELRAEIWRDTLRIASDFPAVGTGLNTYGYATLFYQVMTPAEHWREAHSDYLQLAAEGGVLLGVPMAITIALFVHEVRRRFADGQAEGSTYWIRVGAVTGLVAIALQSAGEFSLQMPGNAALFAVLAGIAVHDSRARGFERHQDGPRAPTR